MTEPLRYAIPDGVLTAQLSGEAVLLHLGSKRYFRLNQTGAAIWRGLESGLDVAAITDSLVRQFAVDRETAGAEVVRLLARLLEYQLITE
jgi:hypothetical protein